MEKLVYCPSCHGKGTTQISFEVWGSKKPAEISDIPCTDCHGAKEVTHERAKEIIRFTELYKSIWCKCGNPSKQTKFHPKGNAVCAKHCYTCADCGKITQIG